MSLMGSIYLGTSGIMANQNALNTTAHNLANVDTAGYTRQQVLFSDTTYNTLNKSMSVGYTQVGLGVSLAAVRQVRNQFVDASYRLESGREAFYSANFQAMSEMETLFGEMEGVAVQTSISELWSAISELAKQPNDSTQLALLKEKAGAFVKRCNAVSKGLTDYQNKIDLKVRSTVDRINELGNQIYNLNQEIHTIEAGGVENANDLRDLRNSALDELGSLIKIDYKEDADGTVLVRAEGADFVVKTGVYEMGSEYNNMTGFTTPVWPHLNNEEVFSFGTEISTNLDTDIGKLKAYVLSRGKDQADYTDMPVEPDADDYTLGDQDPDYLDALDTYNKQLKEYNLYTSSSVINNIQAEFDQLFHSIVTSINDILCPNKTVTLADGTTCQVLDEENCSYGADGQIGVELFSRNGYDRYTKKELTLQDGTTKEFYVYNEEIEGKRGTLYTVGNVEINPTVMQDATSLGMTTASGKADYARALQIVDAWSNPFAKLNPYSYGEADFQTYYIQLIGEIGNLGSAYSNVADALASTTEYLDTKRNQVAGVSSDEELTNMIKFQNAYNASSRYINVVSELLEQLIEQLGSR